jgi:hypothetical protein
MSLATSHARLACALSLLVALIAAPSRVAADEPTLEPAASEGARRGAPWTLELSLDHGVGLWKPAGERWEAPNAVGSLDARLHGGLGLGAMVRVGLVQLGFSRFELETGPSLRGWVLREGPRGLQLGGALGVSVALRFDGPRPGLLTEECVPDPADGTRCRRAYDGRFGAFGMMHLDYREHGFFVGVAALGRWLPHDLQSAERWSADFAVDVVLRVGGEVEL